MGKKAKWLGIFLALFVIISSGFKLYAKFHNDDSPEAQQKAISEALHYQAPAGTVCTAAITHAVHTKTGAQYTFQDGCLPPGWETR